MGRQHKPWQAEVGLSRAGRLVVLHYNRSGVRLSHKAKQPMADGIVQMVEDALPEGWGAVLKRVSLHSHGDEIIAEMAALLEPLGADIGTAIAQCELRNETSLLYHGDDITAQIALMRRIYDVRCETDDSWWADMAQTAREACARKIVLDKGAVLFCEPTQAVLAIDIDSGQSRLGPKALAKYVGPEIMKIIRLASYSGVVVVDMPRLRPDDMAEIVSDMRQAALDDSRNPEVLGVSRAGLVEVVIRHRYSLLKDRLGI